MGNLIKVLGKDLENCPHFFLDFESKCALGRCLFGVSVSECVCVCDICVYVCVCVYACVWCVCMCVPCVCTVWAEGARDERGRCVWLLVVDWLTASGSVVVACGVSSSETSLVPLLQL